MKEHVIEYNGESHNMRQWAKILNMAYEALRGRINRGWSMEKIVNTKTRKKENSMQTKVTLNEDNTYQVPLGNWTAEEDNIILQEYQKGSKLDVIAQKLNHKHSTDAIMLRYNDLKRLTQSDNIDTYVIEELTNIIYPDCTNHTEIVRAQGRIRNVLNKKEYNNCRTYQKSSTRVYYKLTNKELTEVKSKTHKRFGSTIKPCGTQYIAVRNMEDVIDNNSQGQIYTKVDIFNNAFPEVHIDVLGDKYSTVGDSIKTYIQQTYPLVHQNRVIAGKYGTHGYCLDSTQLADVSNYIRWYHCKENGFSKVCIDTGEKVERINYNIQSTEPQDNKVEQLESTKKEEVAEEQTTNSFASCRQSVINTQELRFNPQSTQSILNSQLKQNLETIKLLSEKLDVGNIKFHAESNQVKLFIAWK